MDKFKGREIILIMGLFIQILLNSRLSAQKIKDWQVEMTPHNYSEEDPMNCSFLWEREAELFGYKFPARYTCNGNSATKETDCAVFVVDEMIRWCQLHEGKMLMAFKKYWKTDWNKTMKISKIREDILSVGIEINSKNSCAVVIKFNFFSYSYVNIRDKKILRAFTFHSGE